MQTHSKLQGDVMSEQIAVIQDKCQDLPLYYNRTTPLCYDISYKSVYTQYLVTSCHYAL